MSVVLHVATDPKKRVIGSLARLALGAAGLAFYGPVKVTEREVPIEEVRKNLVKAVNAEKIKGALNVVGAITDLLSTVADRLGKEDLVRATSAGSLAVDVVNQIVIWMTASARWCPYGGEAGKVWGVKDAIWSILSDLATTLLTIPSVVGDVKGIVKGRISR